MEINGSDLSDIIQTAAIIITLAFTFWQWRQNRYSIKIDNYSKIIGSLNQLRDIRMQNPDVERSLFKSREKWSDSDIIRRVYAVELANIFEWSILAYKNRLISKKEWVDWSSMWKRVILADKSMKELLTDETVYTFNLEACSMIKAWISDRDARKPSRKKYSQLI